MKKENREIFHALGLITQIGLTLLTTVFLCVFIGHKMDATFGTSFWFPIWLLLGLLAGFRNIYELVKKFYSKDKQKEDKELEYFESLKRKDSSKKSKKLNK
ncbi:AtpZ/AtpI family protein [Anaerosporobacter sp.]|uniref:AtpZ/AtpI family protein n=1 Tax=Anaerosporobacter sp. TaxID=1872529 RepID=UPI00286F3F32|nr:AtpZ/AtpI family protein [Anaerosporobacter sp.]